MSRKPHKKVRVQFYVQTRWRIKNGRFGLDDLNWLVRMRRGG